MNEASENARRVTGKAVAVVGCYWYARDEACDLPAP